MQVTLEVPSEIPYQLVYRQVRSEPFDVPDRPDARFVFLGSAREAIWERPLLTRCFGAVGALKAIAKIATGKRKLYLVTCDGQPVSTGWCSRGMCRYYKIEPDAVVIGPIESSPAFQSRGLATYGLKGCMNALIGLGHSVFYIDTSKTNYPSQRVIEKCRFGTPVALYFK